MYLIREAKLDDADALLKLAKTSHFINLPPAKDLIEEKVRLSRKSLRELVGPQARSEQTSKGFEGPVYMFVAEDTTTGHCLGTSMVIARMGSAAHPNVVWKLGRRESFSQELHIGSNTTTIELGLDGSGPTEVGGLILSPSYRGHPSRVGKQLALIRFHFIGRHRQVFSSKLLAEMMAPISADGNSPFWEYVGRRFINLTYEEVYRFSQRSRDFMTELLPKAPIYVNLLPPEARRVIGAVAKDTEPAVAMLRKMGFELDGNIDPFDGGPHLTASTDDVPLVKQTWEAGFAGTCTVAQAKKHEGFVSVLHADGRFRALHTGFAMSTDGAQLKLPRSQAKLLELEEGMRIAAVPVSLSGGKTAKKQAKKTKSKASKTKKKTGTRTTKKAS